MSDHSMIGDAGSVAHPLPIPTTTLLNSSKHATISVMSAHENGKWSGGEGHTANVG